MEFALFTIVFVVIISARLAVSWGRLRAELDLERPTRELVKRGRRLDASAIGDVPESSVVRVIGEVKRLERWVVAPISKRSCAHWHLKVSVLEYSPAARRTCWRAILEQSEGLPFVLASGADECVVDPSLATVSVKHGRLDESKRGRGLPAGYVDYLEGAGVSVEPLRRTKVRFEESIVAYGTKTAVVGPGRIVPRAQGAAPETSYRASQPNWLCLNGTDDGLLISDDRRLLQPRGNGGGIKTEPPRRRESYEPSRSAAWAAMDVDQFEGRLAVRRVLWRIGLAAIGVVAIAAIVVTLLSGKKKTPAVATDDQCDFAALSRDYETNGAAAIQAKLTYFDTHCTSSVPYRHLHFEVQRTLGNVRAAADDAEQLLEHEPSNADVWLALAADRGGIESLRQGLALASGDEQRWVASKALERIEQSELASKCEREIARFEINSTEDGLSPECLDLARGHATVAATPNVVSVKFGSAIARATVDARVGTTLVSPELAERAGLSRQAHHDTVKVALEGKLMRGERAVASSCTVGATSISGLPVLVTALPNNLDAVIGFDYLWRFARAAKQDGIELFERRSSARSEPEENN